MADLCNFLCNDAMQLIMSVYGIVECCSQRGGVGTSSSPARVVNMFGGKVPPSLQDRLLTAASEVLDMSCCCKLGVLVTSSLLP